MENYHPYWRLHGTGAAATAGFPFGTEPNEPARANRRGRQSPEREAGGRLEVAGGPPTRALSFPPLSPSRSSLSPPPAGSPFFVLLRRRPSVPILPAAAPSFPQSSGPRRSRASSHARPPDHDLPRIGRRGKSGMARRNRAGAHCLPARHLPDADAKGGACLGRRNQDSLRDALGLQTQLCNRRSRVYRTGFAVLVSLVLCSYAGTGEALSPPVTGSDPPFPTAAPHAGDAPRRHPSAHLRKRSYANNDYYAVELDNDLLTSPSELAELLSMTYVGQIGELVNHHLFEVQKDEDPIPGGNLLLKRAGDIRTRGRRRKRVRRIKRSLDASAPDDPDAGGWPYDEVDEEVSPQQLRLLDGLLWSEKQIPRRRVKRGFIPPPPDGYVHVAPSTTLDRREVPPTRPRNPTNITDPYYYKQWHLENESGNDVNVTGAWLEGVTGRNVTVALLDDGLDFESLDLKDNFFAAGSHDFNDNTELPRPILDDDVHGTRCAGEIAAVRDNNVCGVGVAYNARVSGIRILSKDITDADEAMALNYRYHDNHIMSCSWGPPDDGASADAPQGIIAKAVVNGVTNGRNGKGTIYVFATGNGGLYQDNCNFDGYTNSVYTLTIGAIDILNRHPYYSEACSAQIAVTYSSGAGHFIFTTDVGSEKCAANHGGTSAAAPLAAGLLALVLDVRPDLNWRDVQHICIRTAEIVSADDEDWKPTYAGRKFNHKFGYGRLDAYRMVTFARTWKSVKPQTRLQMPPVHLNATIPFGPDGLQSNVTVTHEMVASAGLERLEHVTVTVNLNHSLRGDVEIMLVSPNGVESRLAEHRENDKSTGGLQNWTFMSVKHWDEPPEGTWILHVFDRFNKEKVGILSLWTLTFWGEREKASDETPDLPPEQKPTTTAVGVHPPTPSAEPSSPAPEPATGRSVASRLFAPFASLLTIGGAVFLAKRRWWDRLRGAIVREHGEVGFSLLSAQNGSSIQNWDSVSRPAELGPVAAVSHQIRTPSAADILDRHVRPDELFEAFHDDAGSEVESEFSGGGISVGDEDFGIIGGRSPRRSAESTDSYPMSRTAFPNADRQPPIDEDDEDSP